MCDRKYRISCIVAFPFYFHINNQDNISDGFLVSDDKNDGEKVYQMAGKPTEHFLCFVYNPLSSVICHRISVLSPSLPF